jgi:acyl-CoA reductase-like NAD-dependent aldehyde dehydrogenase
VNYPVNLSLMPVVTAIAAGNRVILKPSKFGFVGVLVGCHMRRGAA